MADNSNGGAAPDKLKTTVNKWKFLADRVVHKSGAKRTWTRKRLEEEFVAFVNYYSETRTVYLTKTKQKKGGNNQQEAQAERVERVAPMTETAFCVWMGKDSSWLTKMIRDYKAVVERDDKDKDARDIYDLLVAIRSFLNSQVLEGAIIGEYAPTLVANLLGIKNSVDVTSNGENVSTTPVINIVEDTKQREEYKKQSE